MSHIPDNSAAALEYGNQSECRRVDEESSTPVTSRRSAPFRPKIEAKGGPAFLTGGGQMGERTRELDWADTPVGCSADSWPGSLKTAVSICLGSRHPIVVWWDRRYYTQFYNDAYISFLGNKHPDSLGQSARRCWSEIWPVIGPMLEGVFDTGEATWSEDLLLILDRRLPREEGYFTFSYSPIRDDAGSVGGIFCACNETTARVLSERRLRTLRDLNQIAAQARTAEEACEVAARILADNPGDIPYALIYLVDSGAHHAKLAAATGLIAGDQAAPLRVRLGETSANSPGWPLEQVLATGMAQQVYDTAARFGALPGGLWPEPAVAARIVPIAAPGQTTPTGFLVAGLSPRRVSDDDYCSFLDLLASHLGTSVGNARAYQDERRRAEALAEIDRAKTMFFSNVSHEFRTPLTLMLGPVSEALTDPQTPAQVRALLEIAQRSSLRLLKLVNSLLDFSRIEAGRAQACYEETELGALTADLASSFRSAMERAGLTFSVDCQEIGAAVYVDREMWEKIVLNLLSNALKFTFRGSVTVRLRRQDGEAALEIADSGVGIPEHELPRIFERFHRVEGARGRTHEGSGIGLALVQELVKLHGGTIRAQSALGTGTSFEVRIPLGAAHLPPERIKAPSALASTAIGARAFVQEALRWIPATNDNVSPSHLAPSLETVSEPYFVKASGARILLADDNADMRSYLADLLAPVYRIESVGDGKQALEAARRKRPDLIVADIMMPGVDGIALLKSLRADAELHDVPVILLSARAGEEARVAGLASGADDYLVKPFSARELLVRIGALLALTRMRRENQERFHAFASATSDVVFLMNSDWSEMRFLQGRDFIADSEGPNGTWLDKYIYPDDQPKLLTAVQEAIRARSVFQLEHRVRRLGGTTGWVLSRAVPLKNEHGEVCEWFGTASDITKRKLVEEALVEADRRKNEFLAMLGHELRNPLAPIGNASEILSRMTMGDSRALAAVDIIKRQVSQLTRLVDELLDVSRVTQGRVQLERGRIDVADLIAHSVETIEPTLRKKQHTLSVTSLSYEPLYVEGDFTRLVQCVVNVLSNAVKYTDPGGAIGVRTGAEGSSVIVEVTDNGAGIAPELLGRVFDLFVQSDRTLDRAQGGLGIGLSITKRLVEMHGGQICAHSPGLAGGSTFRITLPRISRPQAPNSEATPVKAPPRRVLIVDDNVDAANSLSMLLSLQGHDTQAVYAAREAVERAVSFKPDVALLDIGLPEMNGYELVKQLRAIPQLSGIRFIALTGYGQAEDYQRARTAGFNGHLVKPVDLRALERAVAGEVAAGKGTEHHYHSLSDPASSRATTAP
jgi:signal transduction histidine kinase